MAFKPLHLFSQLNTTLRCCIVGFDVKDVENTRSHPYHIPIKKPYIIPRAFPQRRPKTINILLL
ncbi:hypothetical protein K445DRAFT_315974 [Daldinia sp. EC12]|nr:hypothetical protein K445DRAFT_315974 [Daldinia sp. EC12]